MLFNRVLSDLPRAPARVQRRRRPAEPRQRRRADGLVPVGVRSVGRWHVLRRAVQPELRAVQPRYGRGRRGGIPL